MVMKNTAAVVAALVVLVATGTIAQESSLRAEQVVDYRPGRAADLNARIGAVRIQTVEFSDLGRNYGQGGLAGKLRPAAVASEASTTIRAHFLAENPTSDEWTVTFTLEFLDRSGAIIDKASKRSSWEGEAKAFNFDHPLLSYVVPMVDKVRIKLEGKLD